MPLRRHHDHVLRFDVHFRHREQIVGGDVVDRLEDEVLDHRGLPARRRVHGLRLLECGFPIIAESHLSRSFQHFGFVPRELTFGERDELLGGVWNQFILQVANESVATASATRNARLVGLSRVAVR